MLAEFGDDQTRYASAKARKNYAGISPITRQSGRKKTVQARYVHNDRLIDALHRQAQGALSGSPGARAYYDRQVRHEALDVRVGVRDLRRSVVAAAGLKLGAA